MKLNVYELFGWYGVLAILAAYISNSFHLTSSSSLLYQVLNFTGAIGIIIDAYKDKNIQPVVLNSIWMLIALISLLKIIFSIV